MLTDRVFRDRRTQRLWQVHVNPEGTFHVRMKSTGDSSKRYGKCECCGKHVSDVFIGVELREYKPGRQTYNHARGYRYGHEACLRTLLGSEGEHESRGDKIQPGQD